MVLVVVEPVLLRLCGVVNRNSKGWVGSSMWVLWLLSPAGCRDDVRVEFL